MNRKVILTDLNVISFTTDTSKRIKAGMKTWSDCPMISCMSCEPPCGPEAEEIG